MPYEDEVLRHIEAEVVRLRDSLERLNESIEEILAQKSPLQPSKPLDFPRIDFPDAYVNAAAVAAAALLKAQHGDDFSVKDASTETLCDAFDYADSVIEAFERSMAESGYRWVKSLEP